MGSTLKNYQRKKRRERKEAYKELEKVVRNEMVNRFLCSINLMEAEIEVYKQLKEG